nr:MFS transporter [Rhodocyclus gracilis]
MAEILSMSGFALAPSLLPHFTSMWQMSATQGGWLGGVYFIGYILAVPLLLNLTDRIDARRVHLAGALMSALALAGFALTARALNVALAWWWLAGLALAGTYMPGLKALTDRLPPSAQSRCTAFYTASFGVGAGISFLWVDAAQRWLAWPTLFGLAALASLAAAALVWLGVAPKAPVAQRPDPARWRRVLRDRRVIAYCGAYFGHNWELFAFRSWLVAYLVWVEAVAPSLWTSSPGLIAALATFLAVPASILGNEGAQRWGRRRWLTRVMPASGLLALAVALTPPHWSWLLAPLLLTYAATMNLDSAAMTAGLLTGTAPSERGAALAVYATVGFAGAGLGPVLFGLALDLVGPGSRAGWGAGFLTLAAGIFLGRWAIARFSPAAR